MNGHRNFRAFRPPPRGKDQRRDHPPPDKTQKTTDGFTKGSQHAVKKTNGFEVSGTAREPCERCARSRGEDLSA